MAPSAAAEERPEKVSALVYLCAFLLPDGSSFLSISDARWGSVPRYYIECTEDRAIPPAVQRAMHTGIPVEAVFQLPTSHAPNFSAPTELAGYLMEVARRERRGRLWGTGEGRHPAPETFRR